MGHQGTMAAPFSRRTETVASQISLTAAASENIEQHHPRVSSSLLHPTVFSHVCSHCNMFKLFGFRTSLQGVFCGIRSCPWHDLGLYMAVRCRLGSSHCHWHFLGMDASSLSTPQHSDRMAAPCCAHFVTAPGSPSWSSVPDILPLTTSCCWPLRTMHWGWHAIQKHMKHVKKTAWRHTECRTTRI